MYLKLNSTSLYLIFFGYLASIIAAITLPFENQFIIDYYSKRALILFSLPLLILVVLFPNRYNLKKEKLIHIGLYVIYLLILISLNLTQDKQETKVSYLITELVQFTIFPILLFLMYNISNKSIEKFLLIISYLTIFAVSILNLKAQISYLGIISVFFVVLIEKNKTKLLLLSPLLVLTIYNSLLGKSSIIIFIISLIMYLYVQRKIKLGTLFLLIGLIVLSTNLSLVKDTGAYRNSVYFLRNVDFEKNSFDNSTFNRIYEAMMVNEVLGNSFIHNLFGLGLGSHIDMSNTPDRTVIKAQNNPAQTRNVHLLYFYLKLKTGYFGLFIFYFLFVSTFYKGMSLMRNSLNKSRNYKYVIFFLVSYYVIILWDGQVSASHLMTNYLFWFSLIMIRKYYSAMTGKMIIFS